MATLTKDFTNFLTPPSSELGNFLLAENQLVECYGCDPSLIIGKIIKELGYGKIGATLQANKSFTGLYGFKQTPAIRKLLATINDATDSALTLKYWNGASWVDIALGGAWNGYEDAEVDFETFLGYCFMVGYDKNDGVYLPVATLTGTTFSTSSQCTNMPKGKFIKRYGDRLYVANLQGYPYRFGYSNIPSGGNVTWNGYTNNYEDVDFGDDITGMGKNWNKLIIFTLNSAYLYNRTAKQEVWDVGCASHKTIKNFGQFTFWASLDNIWVSSGGFPEPVGNNVLQYLKNSDPNKWKAEVIDREYHLYVGDTIANGIQYYRCELIYNIQSSMWRTRTLADNLTQMAKHLEDSGKFALYFGNNLGEVMRRSKRSDATMLYSDNGVAINARITTKAYDLGQPKDTKKVTKMITYVQKGQGMKVRIKIQERNQVELNPDDDIGEISDVIQEFSANNEGRLIVFQFEEFSDRESFEFEGFTANYELTSNV